MKLSSGLEPPNLLTLGPWESRRLPGPRGCLEKWTWGWSILWLLNQDTSRAEILARTVFTQIVNFAHTKSYDSEFSRNLT